MVKPRIFCGASCIKKRRKGAMDNVVYKRDLARRISKRYKGIGIDDAEIFIDILCKEILHTVIEDGLVVDLPKVCRIGLKTGRKFGYDFTTGSMIKGKQGFRIFCKPNNYIKSVARNMSPNLPEHLEE